jgi:hypothetical protein
VEEGNAAIEVENWTKKGESWTIGMENPDERVRNLAGILRT